ncbi:30S ribosomal protein S17 [bacterium]|nr:MAG: 30S ribosomal protein S17 [bacterium]
MAEKKQQTLKQQASSQSKVLVGEVVSDKMDKTVVVKISRTLKHPVFGKVIQQIKKYKAHDQENSAGIGDVVEIVECRPLSKTKHMVLNRIVAKRA